MNIRNFTDIKSLLFYNRTTKQTIFKNVFWLAVAEGISRLLKLLLIIYVARILGATEYGKFSFALAFVSLFVVFSNFGLSHIITREFSREKEKEREFSSIFTLKILLSIGALILVLVGSFFITADFIIQKAIWILAVCILIDSFLEIIYAFLRARQQMQHEAWAKILQSIVVTSAGFFAILNFPSIQNLSYSYLLASLIALIFVLIFFHFKIYNLCFSWDKHVWQKFLAMSWPLGFIAVFATIYNQIDSVMMSYWGQITETGWYNAAYRVANVSLLPGAFIAISFYPALSIAFKESKERLQMIWDYRIGIAILIAVPLMAGGLVLAPRIIDFIYGQDFYPSIFAFQILIVVAGIMILIGGLSHILIVSNQQKKNFWLTGSGAIVNIVLNSILIPEYSLYGAATATLVTMFLMFIFYFISVSEFTSVKPLNLKISFFLLSAVLSIIPMCFIIFRLLPLNFSVLFIISIGMMIYLVFIFIFSKIFKLKLI